MRLAGRACLCASMVIGKREWLTSASCSHNYGVSMLSRFSLVPSWMGRYFFFRGRVFRVSRTVSWRLASDVVCREITRPPDALASVGFC